ncbi:MAG: diiron oxygenase, partial [Acidimicrobiales bacterium]
INYMLHEIGEETRHSRLFVRLQEQLTPAYKSPYGNWVVRTFENAMIGRIIRRPALLCVLILGGEEIPDLFQKLASEHPDTDPFVKAVNRYHRQEEARHLAFGRMLLAESWPTTSRRDRAAVRHFSPVVIGGMFANMVDPGVYRSVGLPMWKTWKAVQRTPQRTALRQAATRPILATLMEAGVFGKSGVTRGWRRLCGVDRRGRPLASAPELSSLMNWA